MLEDLQELLKKYESLGTQSKRTWDRIRWGAKGIAELRARIISSIGMLGVFLRFDMSSNSDSSTAHSR